MLEKTIKILWRLFLLTFPFSIHFVLYDRAGYHFGNFNPWVTGFLFLPELLLILIFSLWFAERLKSKTLKKLKQPSWTLILLLLFLVNAGLVTFFQGDMTLYLFFLIRVVEAGMVFILIHEELIPSSEVIRWLLFGALFQILLAYLQTRFNHSLGFHWIGEPVIGPQVLNVAKTTILNSSKLIRPYGTFLHPNILGAYLLTILFLSLGTLKKLALPFWIVLLSIGIYLTGSQAAQLTLLMVMGLFILINLMKTVGQKRNLSLLFFAGFLVLNAVLFFRSASLSFGFASIQERLMQNVISLNMFLHHWWGVGVGNFTLEMEKFSSAILSPWDFQPVHNVYFLVLNETGIQGLLMLIFLIVRLLHAFWKKGKDSAYASQTRLLPLLALIIMASFDHLLWTSWIGSMLIALVVAENSNSGC